MYHSISFVSMHITESHPKGAGWHGLGTLADLIPLVPKSTFCSPACTWAHPLQAVSLGQIAELF